MPSEPVKWATSAETEAVSWPIDVMNNAPWNILDSTGTRVAICGYDNDHEKSGPRLAYAIVGMIRNLKADNETLRREYEREDRAHEQTAKERDDREAALDAFVDAVGGVEVCGEHSNTNDPWANALREVQDAQRERDELRKGYADAVARFVELCTSEPHHVPPPIAVTDTVQDDEWVTETVAENVGETATPSLASRVEELERSNAGLTATLNTTSAETNRANVRISDAEALMKRAEVSKANEGIPLSQRMDEFDVWASRMTNIVAALRRDVDAIREWSRTFVIGDSMHKNTVDQRLSDLRREVDALRRLNTSDASSAPIEQDAGKVCNLPPAFEVRKSDDGRFRVWHKASGWWWCYGPAKWGNITTGKTWGQHSTPDMAISDFLAQNPTLAEPEGWPKGGKYEVVPDLASWMIRRVSDKKFVGLVYYKPFGGKDESHDVALLVAAVLEERA